MASVKLMTPIVSSLDHFKWHEYYTYRQFAFDNRTALEEITGMAERGEISWSVIQALVAHNRKEKPHWHECVVSLEKRGSRPIGNAHDLCGEE